MAGYADAEETRRKRDGMLWVGLFAGPVAWGLDFLVSYLLVWRARTTGRTLGLHLATAAALAVTGLGAALAWRVWSEVRDDGGAAEGRVRSRARFMALCGLLMCAGSALLILATAIPKVVLRPVD